MEGQGNASNNNSLISQEEQRQYESFFEWLDQGRQGSLLSQLVQPGISSENKRGYFVELMNLVDAELTARCIGFQRTNPESGPVGNGPLMVQQGNVSTNVHLQEALTLNPTEPGEPEAAHFANPTLISSEAYGLEENGDGGGGEDASSSNGRRPSFKRRAPEDVAGTLLFGESSRTVQQQEDVVAHGIDRTGALNDQANFVTQFGLLEAGGGGAYTASQYEPQTVARGTAGPQSGIGEASSAVVNHQTGADSTFINQASIRARQAEVFRRNIRLRRNPDIQDFTPNPMNSHLQTPSPTAMFFPYDHFVNLRAQPVHLTPARQFVQVPEPFQTQQFQVQVPGQGVTTSGAWGRPAHTRLQEGGLEPGNLCPIEANMNLANGNTNFQGNYAASSHDPSNSNSGISAVPTWYPDQAIRYSNRMQQILLRRATNRRGQQRGGRMIPRWGPLRSRLLRRAERQDAQQVLSEYVTVINRRVLFRLPEDEDVYQDMRLDIDDMSYEELISLGNEIGNVSTGLREEAIFANLKVQKYESSGVECPDDDAAPCCCICQEEYVDGEHVGKLDCGHDFHANCIKLWLKQKNQCPICKKTGLAG